MILFSSRRLEQKLATNALTEWQKAKYGLIPMLLQALFGATYVIRPLFANTRPATNTWTSFASGIVGLLITLRGFRRCFQINETIDDRSFLERYAILSLTVTCKFVVIFVPITLAIMGVCYGMRDSLPFPYNNSRAIFSVLSAFLPLVYFALLQRSFRRLRAISENRRQKKGK